MKERTDNSSLPILLAITAAVILSVAGGWFLLQQDESAAIEPGDIPLANPQVSTPEETENDASIPDLDAELRKARLAADADILAYPTEQSALHFYGRFLAAEPEHPVAAAEFDAVLTRISQVVSSHLIAQEFDDAYNLAVLVARQRPDHPLVHQTQQTLNDFAGQLVEQAIQHAQDGNDENAATVLATAEALPGRNAEYFSAVRDSVSEIQQSRRAAEEDRTQRIRQAAADARTAWLEKFRGAIEAGRLIAPAGNSARDYLASPDAPDDQKDQLTDELMTALVSSCQSSIDSNQLPVAEAMLNAADELGDDEADLVKLRDSLESAFVETESSKVVRFEDLVRLKTVRPNYPRRAEARGVSGWVEVLFTVTPTGETADIEVSRAEPQTVFDESAIKAVTQWKFQPREFRGQLISQRATARLAFRLE